MPLNYFIREPGSDVLRGPFPLEEIKEELVAQRATNGQLWNPPGTRTNLTASPVGFLHPIPLAAGHTAFLIFSDF
jgi:hypothetical protein